MATLISSKKSKKWGEEHNGTKLYVLSCYFSDNNSKWNIMGQTTQYHFNLSLDANDNDEAKDLVDKFRADTDFHATIKCYTFSISELTAGTEFECDSADIVGTEIKTMTERNIASIMSREQALAKEKNRVIRLFTKGKWAKHVESED